MFCTCTLDGHKLCTDLGNLATWSCQHNTRADNLHNLSSRATKGLQLSKGALVKRVQGSLSFLDDRLCSF